MTHLIQLTNIVWDVEVIVGSMPKRTGKAVEKVRASLPDTFTYDSTGIEDEDDALDAALAAATEQYGQYIESCDPLRFVQV